MLYTHEEFMEAKGRKMLEAKGFTVKDNLIVYDQQAKKTQDAAAPPAAAPIPEKKESAKEKILRTIKELTEKLKNM